MTDGIIQKVFQEWRCGIIEYMAKNNKTENNKATDITIKDVFQVLNMREKQIIDEIKKEFGRYDEFGDYFYHSSIDKTIVKTLIGDKA